MPRRSLRVSDVATPRSSSKRPTSSEAAAPDEAPRNKRAKKQIAPKKVKVPSPELSEDEHESEESASDGNASGYEESEAEESSDEVMEDESSEEDAGNRRKSGAKGKRASTGKGATPKAVKESEKAGGELWRPGVKTGMEPGTQVIIKKPRARSPGATPYEDNTIHPNTMLFLQDLDAHNDRQWLKMHDPDYRASWKDFDSFLETLTEKITEVDETIPELPTKDIFFRIYRDVRFSKDQTPYKTHFSAAWSRTGRKGPYACYYVQIKPNGGSLIAGGLWMPEASALAKLRRAIDRHPQRLKSILCEANLRKEFLGGVADNERKVVKRFVDEHSETSLKTKPKGYDADHKDIELLRLRNFTLHRRLGDSEVVGPRAQDRIIELISYLAPFITHLNSVVMPDEEASESEDESSDEEEEAE